MPIIRYRKPRTRFERARRAMRILLGFSALALGAAMLVLPGPGLLVIAGGLAILATEYAWARRYLKKFREEGEKLGSIFFHWSGKKDRKEQAK
ncbi:MAG: PGPGW domain-containing protein [bacterium]|nr:PGPGW domain-containing protein [bacterium]